MGKEIHAIWPRWELKRLYLFTLKMSEKHWFHGFSLEPRHFQEISHLFLICSALLSFHGLEPQLQTASCLLPSCSRVLSLSHSEFIIIYIIAAKLFLCIYHHVPTSLFPYFPFSLLFSSLLMPPPTPIPNFSPSGNSRTPSAVGFRCWASASRWWPRAGTDPDPPGGPWRSTARRWRWAPGCPSPDSPSCPRKAWRWMGSEDGVYRCIP